ncbi:MAG: hypothetical protein ABIO72_05620 [Patescibacteria group bacterium]
MTTSEHADFPLDEEQCAALRRELHRVVWEGRTDALPSAHPNDDPNVSAARLFAEAPNSILVLSRTVCVELANQWRMGTDTEAILDRILIFIAYLEARDAIPTLLALAESMKPAALDVRTLCIRTLACFADHPEVETLLVSELTEPKHAAVCFRTLCVHNPPKAAELFPLFLEIMHPSALLLASILRGIPEGTRAQFVETVRPFPVALAALTEAGFRPAI